MWKRDRKDWAQVLELKADWRGVWEYQKWKVQTNATRAQCWEWEIEEVPGPAYSMPAADLSLPIPCQLSHLSPRKQQRSSSCRRYPRKAVQTYCIRPWLWHQVCQNSFCRRTVHWFLPQWIQNQRDNTNHIYNIRKGHSHRKKCKACVHTAKLFSLFL